MTNPHELDSRVRLAAFKWVGIQMAIHGDVLPWALLINGFVYEGHKVPLVSMQGSFKPQILPEIPLTIRHSWEGPYDDHFGSDDTLRYAYRGEERWTPFPGQFRGVSKVDSVIRFMPRWS